MQHGLCYSLWSVVLGSGEGRPLDSGSRVGWNVPFLGNLVFHWVCISRNICPVYGELRASNALPEMWEHVEMSGDFGGRNAVLSSQTLSLESLLLRLLWHPLGSEAPVLIPNLTVVVGTWCENFLLLITARSWAFRLL